MNPKLKVRAAGSGGVFSRRDALDCDYTPEQIRQRLADGRWQRVRRGYYTQRSAVGGLASWEQELADHRLAVHAVMRALRSTQVAVSHWSALVLHGVPVWGVDLGTVHVTRIDGRSGRTVAGFRQHVSKVRPEDLTEVDGLVVTAPGRALVETACETTFESAVVSADAALRDDLVQDDLPRLLEEAAFWPGGPTARAALRFADRRSESVGESRLRVLMDRHGLPRPDLQTTFRDSAGGFVGRVDFRFPGYGVVVEFDGRVKYGDDAREVVLAEKAREDRLRELGLIVVRVTWKDLSQPEAVVRRIRQAFARAAAA